MLEILPDTDPILKTVASEVVEFDLVDPMLRQLVEEMHEAMDYYNGIGLAAPQVGISKRILVAKFPGADYVYINPEIVEANGKQKGKEGCLSFPGLFLPVNRSQTITVKYKNIYGFEQTQQYSGLPAVVIQHEIDHLNGIVFTSRVTQMQLLLARKNMKR